MSEFVAKLLWERGAAGPLDDHSRDHTLIYGSGQQALGSAAPEYKGAADRLNPEEAFVGALSACHMLTFLAVAANRGYVVESYVDDAEAELGKDAEGRTAVTAALLRPGVRFGAGNVPAEDEYQRLHERAHKACFVANSVRTSVRVEARIE